MRKKIVTVLALALAACSSFAACDNSGLRNESTGDVPQEGKKALYVGVYDGAVGYAWAQEIEKMYEAEHDDVDVIIKHKRGEYDDATLFSKIKTSDEDIYFGSSNDIQALAKRGSVLDLTDIVTEKIYNNNGDIVESGATKSIVDTLWDEWEAYSKVDVGDGKGERFYAIPNFTPAGGISYDADLFEAKGYEVPETYDELKTLMDRMVADRIIPFTFSSAYPYIYDTAMAFWANYEGKNNFALNSTFKGTDSVLGEINESNAWKLMEQEGRKAYLQFYYDLAHNSNYTTLGTQGSQGHLDSQNSFVSSVLNEADGKRVAMIVENSFWEREAYGTIKSMEANPEYGWGKRNFKYMIAPVNKENDRKTVLLTYSQSFVFINSASDQLELAADFLQFVQSRQGLATYTAYTGCLRPYDYTMTDAEYQLATPYGRSLIDLTRRDDVDFVSLGPGNKVARAMSTTIFESYWGDYVLIDEVQRTSPYGAFLADSSLTVDDYFKGYKAYMSEEKYTSIYNSVLGN